MSNSVSSHYKLSFSGVLAHGWQYPKFVRDDARKSNDYDLEVQIHSGDYFVTLATVLDQLEREVEDYHVRSKLEDVISDLIHLQDNYRIVKK